MAREKAGKREERWVQELEEERWGTGGEMEREEMGNRG